MDVAIAAQVLDGSLKEINQVKEDLQSKKEWIMSAAIANRGTQ